MNRKIIDIIFMFLIFTLPFKYVPRILWQISLGGPFGQDLVMYPLLIGFVYTVYCQWKYGNVFYKWGKFKPFIIAYLLVLLVSLCSGLIDYPYYNQILSGPLNQIEKLPKVLDILHRIGIPIDEKTLLQFWMSVRPVKEIFFEALYTFGATYMLFCWYHDRVQRAVDILLKVTTVNLVIIAAYGLVDVCYQNGQMWAQNLLMVLNPILHADVSIKQVPLEITTMMFRDAQNRSLFLEPSYYGIYMAFAYPLLWWNLFRTQDKKKKVAFWLLFTIVTFELFLSQSRMALVVNLGIFALFAVICLYRMQKNLIVLLVALLIGGGVAFGGAMAFLRYGQIPATMGDWRPLATSWIEMQKMEGAKKGSRNINADKYFDEGLGSLSTDYKDGQHSGSNHSRFTVQKTHIRIGLENPLFGVGTSLRQGYLREKLDKDPGDEIQIWNKTIDKKGLLRGGFANLGDFTLRFAETGLLGLGLYLFPAFILLWLYGKVLVKRKSDIEEASPFIFSSLSFIGIMATGMGDGLNITFCYWMAMAMGYIITEKSITSEEGEYRNEENSYFNRRISGHD